MLLVERGDLKILHHLIGKYSRNRLDKVFFKPKYSKKHHLGSCFIYTKQ